MIPVGAVFRRQDYLDNDWPGYVGDVGIGINPKLQQRAKEADLLMVMGSKLGEMATGGYTMIDIPVPGLTIVLVNAGADELNRVYSATLAINASNAAFAAARSAEHPSAHQTQLRLS